MASLNLNRGPGVSRYRVNVKGIDFIIDKFMESYEDSQCVIIDEIGMMEFFSRKFREAIKQVLISDKVVMATLSRKFVKKYKDKGQIFFLTSDNFDEIYNRVLTKIRDLSPKAG